MSSFKGFVTPICVFKSKLYFLSSVGSNKLSSLFIFSLWQFLHATHNYCDNLAFQKQGVPYRRYNKNLYILFLYSTQQKGYFQQINQLLLKEKFNLVKYFWSSGLAHFLEGLKGFKRVHHFSALSFLSVSY